jgi:2-oxoglutarate dehydrogenase E2 component (dihydrolipoamide succinyltransferase)
VRKLATEHGVDLGRLQGTGVGGRIRKQDVLDAAGQSGGSNGGADAPAAPAASSSADTSADRPQVPQPAGSTSAPAPAFVDQAVKAAPDTKVRGRTEKMSRLRKVIAQRMTESLQTSAQLTTVVEATSRDRRLRASAKADFEAREGTKLSFLPFFALATVEALKQHPVVNCSIDEAAGTITYHEAEHLGIAVDTERGLLVPVIHTPVTSTWPACPARSPTWPSAPAPTRSPRTSWAAARSRSPTPARAGRCSTPRSSTSRRSASWGPARSSSARSS